MNLLSIRASLASLAMGFCVASHGAVLVSQAPDQVSGTNMSFAQVADNFSLGFVVNLTSIKFWSVQSAPGDYSGSVFWSIYSDASGSPGSVLFSDTATPAAVATGNSTGFGYDEYEFNIAVAFQLLAGDYWLALHNGPLSQTDSVEMLWATSTSGVGPSGQYDDLGDAPDGGWLDSGNEHAFELSGDRVVIQPPGIPEPSTLALLFCGLLAARSVRRQSKNA